MRPDADPLGPPRQRCNNRLAAQSNERLCRTISRLEVSEAHLSLAAGAQRASRGDARVRAVNCEAPRAGRRRVA
jgi:hypothetical protein